MNTAAAESYLARFRKVLEFIDTHLDEDLAVERLGGVAAFSKYHFHRQFTELFGIGVFKYTQLKRLKRASYELAFRADRPIIDIALASGYEGPEAFARAFRKSTGQSPAEFRKQPQWLAWHATYQPLGEVRNRVMTAKGELEQVEIRNFKDTRVAVLEYRGDTLLIGNAIRKFIEWRKENRLPPQGSATFNVVYHHPVGADEGDCHYDLCAAIDREVGVNTFGVVEKTIPAGRCAVLRHTGSDDHLGDTVNYLYSQWLPQSGEELRDFPLFFQRVRFFPDVPEHQAVTDVFLPLR